MKALVVSHGDFAKGIINTVSDFFGANNFYYANISLENGNIELLEKVDKYISDWVNEDVIILTDIGGGSSTQSILKYITLPNVHIITGINLSLLLQIMLLEKVSKKELEEIIRLAQSDMRLLSLKDFELSEDDE